MSGISAAMRAGRVAAVRSTAMAKGKRGDLGRTAKKSFGYSMNSS